MNKKEQKKLVGKLKNAAETLDRLPKAEYIGLSEKTIKHISKIHDISPDKALDIIQFYLNTENK